MRAPESFKKTDAIHERIEAGTAGFGSAGSGHLAGVYDVHVEREVYRAVTDFLKDRFDPFGREGAQRLVRPHPCELIARARADAELMERADALKTQDAPHDAGMREFFAQIVIAQIRVRVPLENGQTREYFKRRLHKGQAHQVLTAQEYGTLACAEYLSRLGLDGIENGLGIIGGEINIP